MPITPAADRSISISTRTRRSRNGNEILIATVPYTAGSYNFTAGAAIPNGTYNVALVVDDGVNAVTTYAGGKLITVSGNDEIFGNGFDP